MGAAADGGGAPPGGARRLTLEEAGFYATVYASAKRPCLAELCRGGCEMEEAEELFATAFEKVMETVNPIERSFSKWQMVTFVKRTAWRCLLDERDYRRKWPEVDLSEAYSLSDDNAESPDEVAEEREAVAMGRDALATLSERDQQIFRQRHQLNLTPEQILQRTPGLSRRMYRKILQRANARVLAALERIEGGGGCEEMEDLLRRYICEEASEAERLRVESHVAHCRSCQKQAALMRGFLLDVASGLLAASSALASQRLAHLPMRLLELPVDGASWLLGAARAARERFRDLTLRGLGPLPGGSEATVGPALTSTTVKVASVCAAGLAAGACVAVGVVPGVTGLVSSGHRSDEPTPARVVHARQHSPSPPPELAQPQPAPASSSPTRSKRAGSRTARARPHEEIESSAPATTPATEAARGAESTASVPESPTVTGDEFGAESGQPVQGQASGPSVSSGSARPSGSTGGGAGSGTASHTKSNSEFGF